MKDFDAIGYKELKGGYNDSDEQLLIEQLKKASRKRILDVGCGDGRLTLIVQNVLPSSVVTGIDNSLQQIEYAKEKAPEIQFEHIDIAE